MEDKRSVDIQNLMLDLLKACKDAKDNLGHQINCDVNIIFSGRCNCGYNKFVKEYETVLFKYNNS